jgi:hypothetical protein
MERSESMEAHLFRTLRVAAVVIVATVSMGARYETPNFIIETKDARQAEQYGKAAERFRRDLAIEWLGEEMPRWGDRCPITVEVGSRLGAGGATTFVFDHGEVFGWRMTIQGSHERVLDSVLPHEITHMILASYFRQPLPRWADEGASTSVEHISERTRHRKMLQEFLREDRGIPFNVMFAMKEYPSDIMPLYAQGYSLSEYLIQQGGKRKFLAFLDSGLQGERWGEAVSHHYGSANLGVLQNAWLGWVSQGCPPIRMPETRPIESATPTMVASGQLPRPEPNLLYRDAAAARVPVESHGRLLPQPGPIAKSSVPEGYASGAESPWRAASAAGGRYEPCVVAASGEPVRTNVSHPAPPQQARQIILEWYRR